MMAGKTLLDYVNLSSPNDYKKNDKIKQYTLKTNKYDKRRHKP